VTGAADDERSFAWRVDIFEREKARERLVMRRVRENGRWMMDD